MIILFHKPSMPLTAYSQGLRYLLNSQVRRIKMEEKLNLIDFFEHFDKGDPYMRAAISELQDTMPRDLLDRRSDWFLTWSQTRKK